MLHGLPTKIYTLCRYIITSCGQYESHGYLGFFPDQTKLISNVVLFSGKHLTWLKRETGFKPTKTTGLREKRRKSSLAPGKKIWDNGQRCFGLVGRDRLHEVAQQPSSRPGEKSVVLSKQAQNAHGFNEMGGSPLKLPPGITFVSKDLYGTATTEMPLPDQTQSLEEERSPDSTLERSSCYALAIVSLDLYR